jgi:hypothetical protein
MAMKNIQTHGDRITQLDYYGIIEEIKKFLESNENEELAHQNL